jgi:TolB protein
MIPQKAQLTKANILAAAAGSGAILLLSGAALPNLGAPGMSSGPDAEQTADLTQVADAGIVFVSMRDGIEDIYIMDPDGSNVRRVTVTEPVEGEERGSWVPAWAPDRSQIAFASNRDDGGSANLYVVDADGSNLRRLTNHEGLDYTPDWSPDGTEIAFLSDRDGFYELYAMDADGSNVRRLTHLEKGENELCCPDWSPDGRKLAFMSIRLPRTMMLQVLDVATGDVTDLSFFGGLPRWSPDGEWIAYWGPGRQVHVMRADGTDSRQVTSMEGMANYPVWSPDGEWIVFNTLPRAYAFDEAEMYIVKVDGSGLRQLTDNDALDGHANWW